MSNFWLPPWLGNKGLLGGGVPLLPQMNLLAGPTENFARSSPVANAQWNSISTGGMAISAGNAVGAAGVQQGNYRSDTFNANHYSQIHIPGGALTSGDYIGASVRNQDNANCYLVVYFNNGGTYQLSIFKKVAGAYGSALATSNCGQQPSNQTLTVIAEGSVIQGYLGPSPTGTTLSVCMVDTSFTTGTPGIESFGASSIAGNWSGGKAITGPFTSTIATDNFVRANGLVSAGQPNWTDLNTTFSGVACSGGSIVSNEVGAIAAQHYSDYRNETYSNDQWAQFARASVTPSGQPFVMGMVRWNNGAGHGYIGGLFDASPPGIQVYLLNVGASSTILASSVTTAASFVNGSVYQCSIKGSRIGVRLLGSEVLTVIDTNVITGQPGLMTFGIDSANNFAAGNV